MPRSHVHHQPAPVHVLSPHDFSRQSPTNSRPGSSASSLYQRSPKSPISPLPPLQPLVPLPDEEQRQHQQSFEITTPTTLAMPSPSQEERQRRLSVDTFGRRPLSGISARSHPTHRDSTASHKTLAETTDEGEGDFLDSPALTVDTDVTRRHSNVPTDTATVQLHHSPSRRNVSNTHTLVDSEHDADADAPSGLRALRDQARQDWEARFRQRKSEHSNLSLSTSACTSPTSKTLSLHAASLKAFGMDDEMRERARASGSGSGSASWGGSSRVASPEELRYRDPFAATAAGSRVGSPDSEPRHGSIYPTWSTQSSPDRPIASLAETWKAALDGSVSGHGHGHGHNPLPSLHHDKTNSIDSFQPSIASSDMSADRRPLLSNQYRDATSTLDDQRSTIAPKQRPFAQGHGRSGSVMPRVATNLEPLPETRNELTTEERKELMRRNTKLVRLLGQEVMDARGQILTPSSAKLPSSSTFGVSSGKEHRRRASLMPRLTSTGVSAFAGIAPPSPRYAGRIQEGVFAQQPSDSANASARHRRGHGRDDASPPSSSVRRRRGGHKSSSTHVSPDRDHNDDVVASRRWDRIGSVSPTTMPSHVTTPLPDTIGPKAAALLGVVPMTSSVPPAALSRDDRIDEVQSRRKHRATDLLSLAPSLQESDSADAQPGRVRSHRSSDSLESAHDQKPNRSLRHRSSMASSLRHRNSQSMSVLEHGNSSSGNTHSHSHSPSQSRRQSHTHRPSSSFGDPEAEVLDVDEVQRVRQERRRRVQKMSRWLGSVVPAHLVAPDEHNGQPAYMNHELPVSALEFAGADGDRDARDKPELGNRAKHAAGSLGLIPAKLKERKGSTGSITSSGLVAPSTAAAAAAVASEEDFDTLSPREKHEWAKRLNKLESVLGTGAAAAALQAAQAKQGSSHGPGHSASPSPTLGVRPRGWSRSAMSDDADRRRSSFTSPAAGGRFFADVPRSSNQTLAPAPPPRPAEVIPEDAERLAALRESIESLEYLMDNDEPLFHSLMDRIEGIGSGRACGSIAGSDSEGSGSVHHGLNSRSSLYLPSGSNSRRGSGNGFRFHGSLMSSADTGMRSQSPSWQTPIASPVPMRFEASADGCHGETYGDVDAGYDTESGASSYETGETGLSGYSLGRIASRMREAARLSPSGIGKDRDGINASKSVSVDSPLVKRLSMGLRRRSKRADSKSGGGAEVGVTSEGNRARAGSGGAARMEMLGGAGSRGGVLEPDSEPEEHLKPAKSRLSLRLPSRSNHSHSSSSSFLPGDARDRSLARPRQGSVASSSASCSGSASCSASASGSASASHSASSGPLSAVSASSRGGLRSPATDKPLPPPPPTGNPAGTAAGTGRGSALFALSTGVDVTQAQPQRQVRRGSRSHTYAHAGRGSFGLNKAGGRATASDVELYDSDSSFGAGGAGTGGYTRSAVNAGAPRSAVEPRYEGDVFVLAGPGSRR